MIERFTNIILIITENHVSRSEEIQHHRGLDPRLTGHRPRDTLREDKLFRETVGVSVGGHLLLENRLYFLTPIIFFKIVLSILMHVSDKNKTWNWWDSIFGFDIYCLVNNFSIWVSSCARRMLSMWGTFLHLLGRSSLSTWDWNRSRAQLWIDNQWGMITLSLTFGDLHLENRNLPPHQIWPVSGVWSPKQSWADPERLPFLILSLSNCKERPGSSVPAWSSRTPRILFVSSSHSPKKNIG